MAQAKTQPPFAFKSRHSATNSCRLQPLRKTFGPLYWLSSFFGHKNCLHRNKFMLGLAMWTTNMVTHFCFDFYEAWAIFGAAWATSVAIFLVTTVAASFCMAKVTLPWLENGLLLLHDDGKFPETLRISRIVLRAAPIVGVCLGCAGGVGQYVCYYMDGATRLDFNNVLPTWMQVMLNICRFTSLLHMFCGFSLFLIVPVCVMVVSQLSMKEFKVSMDAEFKKGQTNLSFERAVTLFEERAYFVKQSSKSCSMMLIISVVSSTLSFTLNSYNFLFVRRLAVYFWFALLPVLWIAIPLTIAAWATETYQTFAGVVLKNWAQASCDFPETETPREGLVTSNQTSREYSCSTCHVAAGSTGESGQRNIGRQYSKRKFTKKPGRSFRNIIRPLEMNARQVTVINVGEFHPDESIEKTTGWTGNGWDFGGQNNPNRPRLVVDKKQSPEQKDGFDDVRARSQSMTGRFDFERFIIYLQCLLPDVGFSVGSCLISWDKVFAWGVFMASLSAVFTQEVLFGSRKNTLGRP